jgi:ribonuclease HI
MSGKGIMRISPLAVALYADGGLVDSNPSFVAGCWAWIAVDKKGEMTDCATGVVPAEGMLRSTGVGNNLMETVALVYALEALPEGWTGDSADRDR